MEEREAHETKPVSKGNNVSVGFVEAISEQGVTGILQEPGGEVAEVGAHVVSELLSVDKLVHSTAQSKVWKGLGGTHQRRFVLGMWEGPGPDIWMLTGNSTHPGVLGSQVQLITVSYSRAL